MSSFRSAALLALATLAMTVDRAEPQEVVGNRVRYEMTRSTVFFEAGILSAEDMGEFAMQVDRGITDIDLLLNHAPPGSVVGPRITYIIRDDGGISRSFRRTVMIPADRVRRRAAPYLHETVHVLVPMKDDCLWLSEGYASYVQSYVAEHVGGYDGVVFSWGGNKNIDRLARRTLNSDLGRAALPYVGGEGEPENLFQNRREVAEPLYQLSHSFVKYLVDKLTLDKVTTLVQAPNVAGFASAITGRTIDAWKAEWLAMLNAMPATSGPTRQD